MPRLAALSAEGCYGARMSKKIPGVTNCREHFVEVVRGGRSGAGLDPLTQVGVVQQPELAIVDHFVFLAFAEFFDGEAQLLLGLIHGVVVQIGNAGMNAQNGLRDAERILARRGLVIDEGSRQGRFALMAGCNFQGSLAVFGHRGLRASQVILHMRPERFRLIQHLLELLPRQAQHDHGGEGLDGKLPIALRSHQKP